MSKRVAVTLAVAVLALAASGSALAGKGKGGGGGKADPTLAIAWQQAGSVTFSVMVPSGTSTSSMVVTTKCYDGWSQLNYQASLSVAWATATVGYAGSFAPPSGESCFAYAHTPTSDTPLPGATFSFVAM